MLAAGSPAAHAADLLLLDSEQATVSGDVSLGFAYVDGELRLSGDTTITAASIYFGPNARLRTCFVEGAGNAGCTAGRSLALRSTGPLILSSGIDLTAGSGAARNGGSLSVQGAQVAIGGDVNTSGSGGGASGIVSITSSGPLSVGAIYAYGAPATLTAGGAIDVGGDVQTQGTSAVAAPDPARVQAAAPVTISSSGGDVRVSGNVSAWGRDAPANAGAGLGGGVGGGIAISGSDVRTGALDSTGGSSVDSSPGPSGAITISARGSLHALGRADASGQNSTLSQATGGAAIHASAGGPLVLAGGAYVGGGQGTNGGMPGGDIALQGQTVTTGQLFAAGANAPNTSAPGNGGAGGSVTVSANGTTSIAQVMAYGGNAPAGTSPGSGGPVSVTSGAGSIATGRIFTQGGYASGGPGANGGPVTLSAQTDLTVADALNASGSSANGDAAPPRGGGSAGNVLLRAATGVLTLSDTVSAEGGSGAGHPTAGNTGGPGGHGGRVDVVAQTLGPVTAILAGGGNGGDYGDDRGPGGAGGAVIAWTDGPLFDDQKVVDTDGGDGHPLGPAGAKTAELSPASPLIDTVSGLLSFTSRSPDAQAYRVLRTVAGGTPEVALETTATSGLAVAAPLCVPISVSVVALHAGVGWTSAPSPAAAYTRQPSATQRCTDAPRLTATKRLRFSRRSLKRNRWRVTLALRSSGIGTAQATLTRKVRRGRKTVTRTLKKLSLKLTRPGAQKPRFTLPKAARGQRTYTLNLVTTAPDGKTRRTTKYKLEVRR